MGWSASRGAKRRLIWLHPRWVVLVVLLSASLGAEPVEFSAHNAEVDPEAGWAELQGDVRVSRGRYQLRAERLRLERQGAGVRVVGPGRLQACPCDEAPIALEFESAELGDSGDVWLDRPRLVSGDVSLLGLPGLALRGPNSAGLLPPRVAYRGPDGAYIGFSAEAPLKLRQVDSAGAPARVRAHVGGYSRLSSALSGARAELDVSSERGRSSLSYETLDSGMLELESHVATSDSNAGLALSVDAMRGSRALAAPGTLARVALPEDRARLLLAHWSQQPVAAYAQIRADSRRGLAWLEGVESGAAVGVSRSWYVGHGLMLDVSSDVLGLTAERPEATTAQASQGFWLQRASAHLATPVGAFVSRTDGQLGWLRRVGAGAAPDQTAELDWAASSQFGLPLARNYPRARHVITPAVQAGVRRTRETGVAPHTALVLSQHLQHGVGAAQQLASFVTSAGVLGLRGRSLGYLEADVLAAGRYVAARGFALVRAPAEGAIFEPAALELTSAISFRAGKESAAHGLLRVEYQSTAGWQLYGAGDGALGGAVSPVRPRSFSSPYVLAGTTASGDLIVPISQLFALRASSSWDFNADTGAPTADPGTVEALPLPNPGSEIQLLEAGFGAGYRHRCGCLGIVMELSRRFGRHPALEHDLGGFARAADAEVRLELTP